jgi:transcription elongation factor GreA
MQPTIPMTPSGHARLKEELQTLKSVERPKVIQAIATAREHGDLRENAEYHAARERQSFVEGRIQHLDSPSLLSGPKVAFGCTVRISNVDTGEEVTYRLVGPEEADIEAGSISISSPLARQLIGRETGDEVQVRTPGGQRNYEVLEVSWR